MTQAKQSHVKHWAVYATCCVIMVLTLGMIQNSGMIFIVPVSEDLGVQRGTLTLYTTVLMFAYLAAATFAGKLLQTFDTKKIMVVAAIAEGLAFGLMGFYHNVFLWYVSGVVLGVALALCGFMAVNVLITNWFATKTGFLVGLASAISSLGGILFNTIGSALITSIGWRPAYIIEGVLVIVLLVPLILFSIRFKPEDFGLKPYGYKEALALAEKQAKEAGTGAIEKSQKGVTATAAFKSPAFYFMFLCAMMCTAQSTFNSNMPGYADSLGYDLVFASMCSSVVLAGATVGKILLGMLNDKIGHINATLVTCVAGIISFFIMLFVPGTAAFLVGCAVFGLAFSLSTVEPPLAVKRIFGMKDYSTIYSIVTIGTMGSGAIFTPVFAYIYDFTGSYVPGMYMNMGIYILAVVFIVCATIFGKKIEGSPLKEDK